VHVPRRGTPPRARLITAAAQLIDQRFGHHRAARVPRAEHQNAYVQAVYPQQPVVFSDGSQQAAD
jgi:hypothetical protein